MTVTLILNGFDEPRVDDLIIVYGELKSSDTYYVRKMLYTRDSLEDILNDNLKASLVVFENTLYQGDYKIVGKVLATEIITNTSLVRSSVIKAFRIGGDVGQIRFRMQGMVTISLEDYKIELVEHESKRELDREQEIIKIQKGNEEREDELEENKTKKWRNVFDKYR